MIYASHSEMRRMKVRIAKSLIFVIQAFIKARVFVSVTSQMSRFSNKAVNVCGMHFMG